MRQTQIHTPPTHTHPLTHDISIFILQVKHHEFEKSEPYDMFNEGYKYNSDNTAGKP